MRRRALSGGGHHGGGHHGGHHGGGHHGGGRGGFIGRGGFGPGVVYDYSDYGPLVIVDDDDEEERKRIAFQAAQQAVAMLTKKQVGTHGLGIFRPHDRVAHPLALPQRRAHPMQGLGAVTGPVPSGCWSAAGFKDCTSRVFAQAQKICSESGPYPNASWASADDCTKDYAANFTGPSDESVTCVSQFCPKAGTTTSSAGYPWNVYSADTLALQQSTNTALAAAGYCPIGTDGKLGAATCGARKTLKESGAVPGMTWPSTCQKFTAPSKTPCGGGGGTAPPVAPPAPIVPAPAPYQQASMFGGGWKTALLLGLGALAIGGAVYYVNRDKQESA